MLRPILLMAELVVASLGATLAMGATPPAVKPELQPGIATAEFIFEDAPFPECHASTIAQTTGGLVAAFFAGKPVRKQNDVERVADRDVRQRQRGAALNGF